jgi:hypothetical protein
MPAKKNTAPKSDPTLAQIPQEKALPLPIVRGSLIRMVRNPEAKARGDFVENRWDAIRNYASDLPPGWKIGVVAYPTYRSHKSIERSVLKKTQADLDKLQTKLDETKEALRALGRSKGAEKERAALVLQKDRLTESIEEKTRKLKSQPPLEDRATYQSWVEFSYQAPGSEIVARYKIVRRSGLLIRHQYARGGRRYAPPPKGTVRPHPFRQITRDELAMIPAEVRSLMSKVADVVKVALMPGVSGA